VANNWEDTLLRYCDLRPKDVEALQCPGTAHPATLAQLRRDGLLSKRNALTVAGAQVLRRALHLKTSDPAPPILEGNIRLPHWSTLKRLDPPLTTGQAKLLRQLAQQPGLAWRFLSGIYGEWTLEKMKEAGLATGQHRRGAEWHLTEAGLELVRGWREGSQPTVLAGRRHERQRRSGAAAPA